MYYEVIPIKLFRQDAGVLTYSCDQNLSPGQIVVVPLGKSETVGIVYKKVAKVDFETKKISKILCETPLPEHLLKALEWLSGYYLAPLPTVANLFLPSGITKKRRKKVVSEEKIPKLPLIPLNPSQKKALQGLESLDKTTKLLHGITGSGKTNIYLEMAARAFKQQKSTILLVPEIALTSQLVQIFSQTFGDSIVLMHSKQTEAERHQIWEKLLLSKNPQIIIGPRSALFAPIHNLGLIIIDEAHEPTYFQENSPKYSALRLGSFIAKTAGINCILGTATPLISDFYLAKKQSSLVTLKEKAKKNAKPPKIEIIDLKEKTNFSKNRYFSDHLLKTIEKNLANHQQTLIFHNRRGSAPLTICEECGWQALCPNCLLPLTLHADAFSLICHICGHHTAVPNSCPECHHAGVIHKGFGTKLLEAELLKLFKNAKICRFDADNTKDQTLDSLYDDVKNGKVDILIGTQALARGLDLPLLASVGIVQADAGLSLPDYAAEERTFHLLTQVIGRVGRGHIDDTNVIIQTYQPDHQVIKYATANNYDEFYNYLLEKRKKQHFPPFVYLATVSVTYKTEVSTLTKTQEVHKKLRQNPNLFVSAPTPAFHEHNNRGYTWQLTVKSLSRQALVKALGEIKNSPNTHFTLDPPSIL